MAEPGDRGPAAPAPRPVPGALSALLAELARAPPAEKGGWDAVLRPGAVIGRFELVREIGRGGFGIVWEARDRELKRAVAFKALRHPGRPALGEDRLLREAEAAASLSHPNVVTLYDFGHAAEGPYLVLELLRGEALSRRLERGPLEPREAARVALEVAKGMAHAHASGVVHRDLTPGNVFLCRDGQVKVLDLGMAHAFGHRRIEGGTPGYMAPEQVRGAPEDERTDVYALGVILFRMLAGRMPPAGGEGGAPLPDMRDVPWAGPLLARMLASDPVERPRDGGEVVAALGALEREMPPEGVPPAPGPRMDRPARRGWLAGGRRRRALVLGAVAVAVAAGLTAILLSGRAARDARGGRAPPSIAVLPFADMSPQKDQEYFSDGMAEEILDSLSRVRGLRVIGRTSSFSFKGSSEDVSSIGRKLGVGAVLEGSVRRAGNRTRITAKIVNASDGFTVWSESYDRELTDVFAVQEDVAKAVVSALQVRLAAGDAPSLASRRTARPEVYDAYLVGRRLFERGDLTGHTGAVSAYEKTTALDPGYAPAWAGLSEALYWASDETADKGAQDDARRRALAAAERAVMLAPDLAAGWSVRGFVRTLLHWDFEGGRKDFERALVLAGGDARVLRDYGCIISVPLGQMQEGIATLVRASELDPLDAMVWTYLAMTYPATGDYDRASRAAERALEVAPSNPYAAFWRAAILLLQDRGVEALALSERNDNEAFRLTMATLAHHTLGDEAKSRQALEALAARYGDTAPYQVGEGHAWRGEHAEAFAWLERARAGHDAGLVLVTRDPFLRGLRADPRYAALLRKMNLPAE